MRGSSKISPIKKVRITNLSKTTGLLGSTDADDWDAGSKSDPMRNDFVIPTLALVLNHFRPKSILDVGAATGFVARTTDGKLDYRPKWTLLDQNLERLNFAKKNLPGEMIATELLGNFFEIFGTGIRYQAIVLCFTLLEIGETELVYSQIRNLCAESGIVIIVLPDVWEDVLVANRKDQLTADTFLKGEVCIQKTDKFTQKRYPFNAKRIEMLIGNLLRKQFVLVQLSSGRAAGSSAFMLVFESRVQNHA